jgi:hypothetical protein
MKRLLVLLAVVMSAVVGVVLWRRRQVPTPSPGSTVSPAITAVSDRLSVPEVTPAPAPEQVPEEATAMAPTNLAAKKAPAKKAPAKKAPAKKSAAKPKKATATAAAAPTSPRRPRTQDPDSAS